MQEGKAVASAVVLAGTARDKLLPVASGLAPGTTVIVAPPQDLAEGRAVKAKAAG